MFSAEECSQTNNNNKKKTSWNIFIAKQVCLGSNNN